MSANKSLASNIKAHRERLQMTQQHVAVALAIPRSGISAIEAGKRGVSAAELALFAQLFGQPVEQLLGLAARGGDQELVMLRAAAAPRRARAQLNRWTDLCEAYRDLEDQVGEPRQDDLRPVRRVLASDEDAFGLADEERERLQLGLTPGRELLDVLEERLGVKVVYLDVDDAISGASVVSERFGPAILVNRKHPAGRRAFTLAHEYFHLLTEGRIARSSSGTGVHLCGKPQAGRRKDRAEQLADAFAGRLLLPPGHFVERLRRLRRADGTVDRLDLIGLAQYFGVSVKAVFVELAEAGLTPHDRAMEAYNDRAFWARIDELSASRAPEPLRFQRLAVKAYLAKRISRARLAELLGVRREEVGREVRRFGGGEGEGAVQVSLPR